MASTNLGTITIVMDDSLITAYRIDNQELKRENQELKSKLAVAEQFMSHNTVLLARAIKAEAMVSRMMIVGGDLCDAARNMEDVMAWRKLVNEWRTRNE